MTHIEMIHYMAQGYNPLDHAWYTKILCQARMSALAGYMVDVLYGD